MKILISHIRPDCVFSNFKEVSFHHVKIQSKSNHNIYRIVAHHTTTYYLAIRNYITIKSTNNFMNQSWVINRPTSNPAISQIIWNPILMMELYHILLLPILSIPVKIDTCKATCIQITVINTPCIYFHCERPTPTSTRLRPVCLVSIL